MDFERSTTSGAAPWILLKLKQKPQALPMNLEGRELQEDLHLASQEAKGLKSRPESVGSARETSLWQSSKLRDGEKPEE